VKKLLLLIVIASVAYFGYRHYQQGEGAISGEITTPVFAEYRVTAHIAGRDIEMALFGKMASNDDCHRRADVVWNKVLDNCKECTSSNFQCRDTLEPRYLKLFDDVAIHSTYISFHHGSPFERDGRMVTYGLTSDEGDKLCEMMKPMFKEKYSGTVECVNGIRD